MTFLTTLEALSRLPKLWQCLKLPKKGPLTKKLHTPIQIIIKKHKLIISRKKLPIGSTVMLLCPWIGPKKWPKVGQIGLIWPQVTTSELLKKFLWDLYYCKSLASFLKLKKICQISIPYCSCFCFHYKQFQKKTFSYLLYRENYSYIHIYLMSTPSP